MLLFVTFPTLKAPTYPLAHQLFLPPSPWRVTQFVPSPLERLALAREYLGLVASHPVPMRMVRGHVHRMVGDWLAEHTDLRDSHINRQRVSVELYIEVGGERRERGGTRKTRGNRVRRGGEGVGSSQSGREGRGAGCDGFIG